MGWAPDSLNVVTWMGAGQESRGTEGRELAPGAKDGVAARGAALIDKEHAEKVSSRTYSPHVGETRMAEC